MQGVLSRFYFLPYLWLKAYCKQYLITVQLFLRNETPDAHMSATLVNDALFMALKKRNPPQSVIWHIDDRGSQYASDTTQRIWYHAKYEC